MCPIPRCTFGLAKVHLGIIRDRCKTINMFIAVLFVILILWKLTKYPNIQKIFINRTIWVLKIMKIFCVIDKQMLLVALPLCTPTVPVSWIPPSVPCHSNTKLRFLWGIQNPVLVWLAGRSDWLVHACWLLNVFYVFWMQFQGGNVKVKQ